MTAPGRITESRGCYANNGPIGIITGKLNRDALDGPGRVTVTPRSENAKTGPMAATYAPQVTCPTSCPFYPEIAGDVAGERRDHVNLAMAREESDKIDALPADRPLRVHVVGDCSTPGAAGLVGAAMVRYERRGGHMAYTYTHAWAAVPQSAWQGARVLASCETARDVAQARAQGYQCEMTYDRHRSRKLHDRDGVRVLPCPNQFNQAVTCAKCMLCAKPETLRRLNAVIGLSAHGPTRKVAKAIAGKE